MEIVWGANQATPPPQKNAQNSKSSQLVGLGVAIGVIMRLQLGTKTLPT